MVNTPKIAGHGAVLLLIGCTTAPGGGPISGPPGVDAAADTGADTGPGAATGIPHEPAYTADEAVAEVALLFAKGMPQPAQMVQDFEGLIGAGDGVCPTVEDGFFRDLNGCTSETGYWYMGRGGFALADDSSGQSVWTKLSTIDADFQILSPQGDEYLAGGDIEHEFRSDGTTEGAEGKLSLVGTWQWEGSPSPWFSEGLSANLEVRARRAPDTGDLTMVGTWATGGRYAYLDLGFSLGDCDGQVSGGKAWLRQPDQTWTRVQFHQDCSGCAEVTWEGELVGEACTDMQSIGQQIAAVTLLEDTL